MKKPIPKPVHFLTHNNYYLCTRAVGNKVQGLATKKKKFVTCENCITQLLKEEVNR